MVLLTLVPQNRKAASLVSRDFFLSVLLSYISFLFTTRDGKEGAVESDSTGAQSKASSPLCSPPVYPPYRRVNTLVPGFFLGRSSTLLLSAVLTTVPRGKILSPGNTLRVLNRDLTPRLYDDNSIYWPLLLSITTN